MRNIPRLPFGFEEFKELFSPELGLAKNQTHTVTVCYRVPPVQAKLGRLPIALHDAANAKIHELEHRGSGIRLSVNLQALNQAVIVDSFPLQYIDELWNSSG